MELSVLRFSSREDDTLGLFHIDCVWECFTLEDEYRAFKVRGDTRIPAGTYEIRFKKHLTPLTEKYRKKYDWFTYHLEICGIAGFNNVYIHIGNEEKNTDACLLVGDTCESNLNKNGFIGRSTQAYKRIYKKVSRELTEGREVTIQIIDNII